MDKIADTDKGASGYIPTYRSLSVTMSSPPAICELGVFRGGSLDMWRAMFGPGALIVGVDNDPDARWPLGTHKILADQQDPSIPGQLKILSPDGYDMIVDDASHQGQPTYKSFEHLWPLVKQGGYYVIEDWCVGFDTYPTYDDSMIQMAMMLLLRFSDPDTDLHFVSYQYGMIVMRKKVQR